VKYSDIPGEFLYFGSHVSEHILRAHGFSCISWSRHHVSAADHEETRQTGDHQSHAPEECLATMGQVSKGVNMILPAIGRWSANESMHTHEVQKSVYEVHEG